MISHIPSSSIPSSSNTIPPPHSCGPSGRNVATSYVHTAATRVVVSQSQVPPVVSRGHILTSVTSIPTHGVSHGTSYGPYYGPQCSSTQGTPKRSNTLSNRFTQIDHR